MHCWPKTRHGKSSKSRNDEDDNEEEDAGGWGSAEEDDESAGIGSVSAIDAAQRGIPSLRFLNLYE